MNISVILRNPVWEESRNGMRYLEPRDSSKLSVALDAVLNVDGFGPVGPRRQEEAIRAGYDLAYSGLALCLA